MDKVDKAYDALIEVLENIDLDQFDIGQIVEDLSMVYDLDWSERSELLAMYDDYDL